MSFELGEGIATEWMAATNQSYMMLLGSSDMTFWLDWQAFTGWQANNQMIAGLQAKHPDRFGALCTIDPTQADGLQHLDRCLDRGAIGIKMWIGHTHLQCGKGINGATGKPEEISVFDKMGLMDARLLPVYDRAVARGIPILYHVNPGPLTADKVFDVATCPLDLYGDLQALVRAYPTLSLICPHWCLSKADLALRMHSPTLRIVAVNATPEDGAVWTQDRDDGPLILAPREQTSYTWPQVGRNYAPVPPGRYVMTVQYGTDPRTGQHAQTDVPFTISAAAPPEPASGDGGAAARSARTGPVNVTLSSVWLSPGQPLIVTVRNDGAAAIDPYAESRLVHLLRTFPNLSTDISLGYAGGPNDEGSLLRDGLDTLGRNAPAFRRVVAEFSTRIMFGTDVVVTLAPYKDLDWYKSMTQCYYDLLAAKRYDCVVPQSVDATGLTGLALDSATQRAILTDNAQRIFHLGPAARPVPNAGMTALAVGAVMLFMLAVRQRGRIRHR